MEPFALGRGAPLPSAEWLPVHDQVGRIDPARIAVRSGEDALTYGELNALADALAARLVAAGAGPGHRVGVRVAPSAAMVAAVLGVLRSGAAYVPVDDGQPEQRVRDVFDDARLTCVVTDLADSGELPRIPVTGDRPEADLPEPDLLAVAPHDAAYLIYTSGSTGEPKGVLVEHGHLAAATLARHLVYHQMPVFLLVSPLAFDSSVAGLWGTLTTGGTLVVATAEEVRDPERLVELMKRHEVTHLLCVPSLYGVVLDATERAGSGPESLRTVVVAGEPLPDPLLARHFAVHGTSVALVNEYGPTETTVWASYRRYDAPGPVSIGGPIPGARLYVLDDDLRPVPHGAEGELVIGGAGVARGYFGRQEATAAVFVDDPFTGGRMYRTGDRARWNDEGTLDFVGRRDHQVKIRGHRVELGAVESALRGLAGVRDAVVVPNEARTQLVGFVLADGTDGAQLRRLVTATLPEAMVPARVEVLDEFPRTFAGKIDRTRLRADDQRDAGTTATGVAAAWAEVLKLPDIPEDANFFDIGGHSLAMFQLQDALERHTGTRPSVVALFRHTTVSAQVELITGANRPDAERPDRQLAARRHAMRARRQRVTREAAK